MQSNHFLASNELLKTMFHASKELEGGLIEGCSAVVHGIEQQQKEFELKKKRIENDIKRGSRLSKGRIPF